MLPSNEGQAWSISWMRPRSPDISHWMPTSNSETACDDRSLFRLRYSRIQLHWWCKSLYGSHPDNKTRWWDGAMGTPGPVARRVFPVTAAGKIRQLLFAFCNGNSWMWVSGYTVVMAFGKPINPSTQAMKISRTPRLRNSVNTDNQNLAHSCLASIIFFGSSRICVGGFSSF